MQLVQKALRTFGQLFAIKRQISYADGSFKAIAQFCSPSDAIAAVNNGTGLTAEVCNHHSFDNGLTFEQFDREFTSRLLPQIGSCRHHMTLPELCKTSLSARCQAIQIREDIPVGKAPTPTSIHPIPCTR